MSYRHVIVLNHSSGIGKIWWKEIGREIIDPTFAKLIDELLLNAQPSDFYDRMATWADQ